jgi:hypothetical protein
MLWKAGPALERIRTAYKPVRGGEEGREEREAHAPALEEDIEGI